MLSLACGSVQRATAPDGDKLAGDAIAPVAELTLIGNAIAVVYAGLSGDLTVQFLAKAAVVAVVSGLLIGWFRGHANEA